MGTCFKSKPDQVAGYHRGDCVQITGTEIEDSDELTLTSVKLADAADHSSDCPEAAN